MEWSAPRVYSLSFFGKNKRGEVEWIKDKGDKTKSKGYSKDAFIFQTLSMMKKKLALKACVQQFALLFGKKERKIDLCYLLASWIETESMVTGLLGKLWK